MDEQYLDHTIADACGRCSGHVAWGSLLAHPLFSNKFRQEQMARG
jgi:hypothetical protein